MESITLNGVSPTGNPEREFEGAMEIVYDDLTLGDYDSANDGNGNTFDPTAVYGFSRLIHVDLQVQGAAYDAQYDYTNNSILVYNLSDGSEVAQGTTLNIDIRANIRGA